MIYWTDVTTQGSMIRRMNINSSNVQVCVVQEDVHWWFLHVFKNHLTEFNLWQISSSMSFCSDWPMGMFVTHDWLMDRCCTEPLWVTLTVWPWTGLGETCTGVIRAETQLRCPSWTGLTEVCWSTAACGSRELWRWMWGMGESPNSVPDKVLHYVLYKYLTIPV